MSNSAVLRGLQVGVEGDATPGTAVAAGKRMLTVEALPKPVTPKEVHAGTGSRHDTHTTLGKEHTMLRLSGKTIGYDDLIYWLASMFKEQAAGSPFTIVQDAFTADDINTLSVEVGNGVRAERIAGVRGRSIAFNFRQQGAPTWEGEAFGLAQEEGHVITPAPTLLPRVSVNPKDWRVLVGDSIAGLAAITRPLAVECGFRDMREPTFYGNPDASLTDHTELKVNASSRLVLVKDSVAAGYMADLRSSARKYLRIRCVGPNISLGVDYELRITLAFQFGEDDPGNESNQWASRFNLIPVYDSVLGGMCEILLVNSLAAL